MWLILIIFTILVLNPSNIFNASAAAVNFRYGVASGDVTSKSAVLWTHTDIATQVRVEVTRYPNFDKLDFSGNVLVTADNDFTAKITATGLVPNTQYLYRWKSGSTISDVGSFKTAPLDTQATDVHFSWSGDTDVSKVAGIRYFGDWKSLQAAQSENPDFFIYLGDTIYSDLRANKPPKQLPDVNTLSEFRQLYKDSRDVTALHDLLRRVSIYPVWDDHEIRDDWAGQTIDKTIFNIGQKSFNEYMPIQEPWTTSDPNCAGPTQFRVKNWGTNADIIILDTRSCRSDSANVKEICMKDLAPTLPSSVRTAMKTTDGKPILSPSPPAGCLDAIKDPSRTLLGTTQKSMFKNALLNSKAKFKFIISSVNMEQTYAQPYDRWEGYAAERSEILNFIRNNAIKNVIFLSTDSHLNLMNKVFIDHFTDPKQIAYEFVTGPIAALTDEKDLLGCGSGCPAGNPDLGKSYLLAKQNILTLLGAECRNLNAYSYGDVSFSQTSVLLKISLKDASGNVIHDEINPNPNVLCTKTFGP
jgi:phosphodiesterase/alkaline phosphatase D-like protein